MNKDEAKKIAIDFLKNWVIMHIQKIDAFCIEPNAKSMDVIL